jgi:hypothetical protein
VIAGTATHVSSNVSRRQTRRWAEQEQAQYPPQQEYAAAPPAEDPRDKQIAQLKELADLKAQGILTEEEFAAQKAQILSS